MLIPCHRSARGPYVCPFSKRIRWYYWRNVLFAPDDSGVSRVVYCVGSMPVLLIEASSSACRGGLLALRKQQT
jgi:hypothetical protein